MKTLSVLMLLAVMFLLSCKDEFGELESLKLQSNLSLKKDSLQLLQQFRTLGIESQKLAASYLAALNEAGELLQVTVLVRADNKPVPGVVVSLTSAAAPATTNEEGVAIFDRVKIGECTINISKSGYTSASALITFGTPGNPISIAKNVPGIGSVTRFIPPAKRFENLGLPIFSLTAEGSTALITGTVTYEKDLTNDTPEIPVGLKLTANLRDALLNVANGGSVPLSSNNGQTQILNYQFSESDLGVATVQANGVYEMRVPATLTGLSGITFTMPQIVENQSAVIASEGNIFGNLVPLPGGPEKRTNIPTSWTYSTGIVANASPTIIVPTAKISFSEVPPPGRGYNPSFTPVSRGIDVGFYGYLGNQHTIGGTTITITNRGEDFTAVPTVTFSPASTTLARANLRGYVTSLSITSAGDYGDQGDNLELELIGNNANGQISVLSTTRIPVQLGPGGTLPLGPIALPTGMGYSEYDPFTTNSTFSNLTFRVVDGPGSPVAPTLQGAFAVQFKSEIASIWIEEGGMYDAAPLITITGGNPTKVATAVVSEYRVQWESDLISASTVPFKVVPQSFHFQWPTTAVSSSLFGTNAAVDVISISGLKSVSNTALKSVLRTDGNKLLLASQYANLKVRTVQQWHTPPQLLVVDEAPRRGYGTPLITNGQITGVSFSEEGNGYNDGSLEVALEPVYAGAPGSGAIVSFTRSIDLLTNEVIDLTASIVSAGSLYRSNANRISQNLTADPIPVVKSGQTYKVDIKLGTGIRLINVGGF